MVRPRKCRRICTTPVARFYKPQGVPVRCLEIVLLKDEELEALALADVRQMDHESAAQQMAVSRPTFSRILAQARKTVAAALVSGAAIRIEGGDFARSHEQPDETQTDGGENASNG